MATTIEKIQTLLSKVSKQKEQKEVKFYAESTLEDGRVIATEDDVIDVGVVVKVIEDDGVAYELEEGDYVLADGSTLSIGAGGVVASLGSGQQTEQPAGAVDRARKDAEKSAEKKGGEADKGKAKGGDEGKGAGKGKLSKIEEEVYAKFEEIKDEDRAKEIIEFIKEKLEEVEEVVEEKEEEEVMMSNEEAEKIEFSSVVGELITRIDELETKLSDIENTPADNGVTVNPTGEEYNFSKPKNLYNKVSRQDVLNMTTSERARFMIQNKLTRI